MNWHVLDASSIWLKEFCSALGRRVPVTCWSPEMRLYGVVEHWQREEKIADPALTVRHFPLQRGYSAFPVSAIARPGKTIAAMLRASETYSPDAPLICTTPYYAPVAERWKGPVVYYQTDLTVKYHGVNADRIRAFDRRLCRVAASVCPNSRRVADYMVNDAGCDPGKITIVPNATREANVYPACPSGPGELPHDIQDMPRPIAGVIGNLAMNMDWLLIRDLVARTPLFSWVFVGPISMAISDARHSAAREEMARMGGRVRFVGSKPYGQLQAYARCFDVAVLPYICKEPTYSGSSTRFYEHLAACRPMISTRGFEELLHKEPLLQLTDTAAEAANAMERLRLANFVDGYESERWRESRKGTWEARADAVLSSLQMKPKPELEASLR